LFAYFDHLIQSINAKDCDWLKRLVHSLDGTPKERHVFDCQFSRNTREKYGRYFCELVLFLQRMHALNLDYLALNLGHIFMDLNGSFWVDYTSYTDDLDDEQEVPII
jgi:hypothetical protein